MLKVENITTGYGKKQVLHNVSFEVKQGEIVLLIGANGSGKSTLLKAIYGLLPLWKNPDTNYINLHEKNNSCGSVKFISDNSCNSCLITGFPPHALLLKGLCYIPQKNNIFEDLSVQENLEIGGLTIKDHKLLKQRIEYIYTRFPLLAELKSRTPMKMSGGERQLLSLAMAMLHQPKMLLCDEIVSGLDARNTHLVFENIKRLNTFEGVTFLIVEHRVKESYEIAGRIIALKYGTVFSDKLKTNIFNLAELNDVFV